VFGIDRTNLQRWIIPLTASALLFAILLFIFPYNSGDSSINSPLGRALWTIWTTSGGDTTDYTYCLLVPLMVGYLLYVKHPQIVSAPTRSTTASIGWIILGLVFFWIGARAGKQYIGCLGVQVIILGLIHWFWGAELFRRLLFTWAIIAFAWPLPFLDTAVAFPLRMIVSHAAYYALNFVGIPVVQSGTALLSAPANGQAVGAIFQIDVADPCSGLHSLLPLLMFSAFFCYFFLPKRWQQWTVFLSAFAFTIAGNVVRIMMLVVGVLLWGTPFAIGTNAEPSAFHEGCGFAVFGIVLGLECLFGYLLIGLDKRRNQAAVPSPHREAAPAIFGEIPAWRSTVIVGIGGLVAAVYLLSPPVYLPTEAGVLMALPEQVKLPNLDGGHFYGKPAAVSEVEQRILPKDTEFARKTYEDFHAHEVFFSIVLSGVQQYTIHPPEVCLVAQGWSIVGQEDIPIQLESGHQLLVRNLSLQRDTVDSRQNHRQIKAYYMYWYVADNITTPSHLTRNLTSSWDRIFRNRDHRWAYVIAMSPITDSFRADGLNAGQTRDMLTSFIREIVPTFQKNELPDRVGKI
jgi:EpsI family protein